MEIYYIECGTGHTTIKIHVLVDGIEDIDHFFQVQGFKNRMVKLVASLKGIGSKKLIDLRQKKQNTE